jgi:hypothetical protein
MCTEQKRFLHTAKKMICEWRKQRKVLQIYEEAWPMHAYLNQNSTKDAEYEANIFEFKKFVIAARKKSCFELGHTDNWTMFL